MLFLCKKNKPEHSLITGKVYMPVAFYAKSDNVFFLAMTPNYRPSLFNTMDFEQIDDTVPDNFIMKTDFSYSPSYQEWSKQYHIVLFMGYEYLINNPEHFWNLIEYEKKDMQIFRKEYYYIVNKYYYEYTRMKPDIKNGLEFTEPALVFEEKYIDRDLEYLR